MLVTKAALHEHEWVLVWGIGSGVSTACLAIAKALGARVIATASDGRQLEQAVRQLEPDAVVAEPGIAVDGLDHPAIFALAPTESVGALRAAIRAGARAFYLWPSEREGLLERA